MKIKALDKIRNQYIPPGEFAVTGDGKLLIQKNESALLYPPGTPSGMYAECDDVSASDCTFEVDMEEDNE